MKIIYLKAFILILCMINVNCFILSRNFTTVTKNDPVTDIDHFINTFAKLAQMSNVTTMHNGKLFIDSSSIFETASKVTKLNTDMAQALISQDIKDVAQFIVSLGELIPEIGPLCYIASFFMNLFFPDQTTAIIQKDLQQMHEAIEKMAEALEQIQKELVNVESQIMELQKEIDAISDKIIKDEFAAFTIELNNLDQAYNAFMKSRLTEDLRAVKERCAANPAEILVQNLNDRLESWTNQLNLNFDIAQLNQWITLVSKSYIQAIYYYSICYNIAYDHYPPTTRSAKLTMDTTIEVDDIPASKVQLFSTFQSTLNRVMSNKLDYIKNNFWGNAVSEIEIFGNQWWAYSHEYFAQTLYEQLARKYHFRPWGVISFDKGKYDDTSGDNEGYCFTAWNQYGRNLYVSSGGNVYDASVSYRAPRKSNSMETKSEQLWNDFLNDYTGVVCLIVTEPAEGYFTRNSYYGFFKIIDDYNVCGIATHPID